MSKLRFFTGITATGTLTLGHYLGVIRHILELQKTHEVIVMIGDLHALTTLRNGVNYRENCRIIAALLYACGLNDNCKVFIQSEIKEHLELMAILSPHANINLLNNMIQFKEKKGTAAGNLSLLSYPVLMAADIFLYQADLIVVGMDQTQHLEFARTIYRKFNSF
jgi:tryptophanyl-tRNA synthetase